MVYSYNRPDWCDPESERDREIFFLLNNIYDLYGYNTNVSLLDVGFAGAGYIDMILDFSNIQYTGIDGDGGRISGQSLCFAKGTREEDIKKWQNTLSRIECIEGDIISHTSSILYDIIISISTIEHIVPVGYSYYHKFDPYRDIEAVDSMKKLSKIGGHLLLTFPCGQERIFAPTNQGITGHLKDKFIQSRHHILIYDEARINKIIGNWNIMKESYWLSKSGKFEECSKEETLNFEYKTSDVASLCALLLRGDG